MIRKFASIQNPETHAYSFDSEAWTSKAQIDSHFRMYETYGDGTFQHSRDWTITTEHFGDYLISLAAAMLEDTELSQRLAFFFERAPCEDDIRFCSSVVFKARENSAYEAKTRYYSVVERKISSSPSKQHDKRYEQVKEWNNGTPEAVYRMLIPEYADGLQVFATATAIRQWAMKTEGQWMHLVGVFLEWTKDSDSARDMQHGYDAAGEVAKAFRLRSAAQSAIDSARRNIERRAAQVAKTAEVAA